MRRPGISKIALPIRFQFLGGLDKISNILLSAQYPGFAISNDLYKR